MQNRFLKALFIARFCRGLLYLNPSKMYLSLLHCPSFRLMASARELTLGIRFPGNSCFRNTGSRCISAFFFARSESRQLRTYVSGGDGHARSGWHACFLFWFSPRLRFVCASFARLLKRVRSFSACLNICKNATREKPTSRRRKELKRIRRWN